MAYINENYWYFADAFVLKLINLIEIIVQMATANRLGIN